MLTIQKPSVFECQIKKSRFVAHAGPVTSQRESLEFYASVADHQATHNCWAWRINFQIRSNDDGEPGGTAGRPILGVIEGRKLENVMVVVSRYFGGIKLGIGGLVRAYSGTTAKCLDHAGVVELFPMAEFVIRGGFEWSACVHGLVEKFATEKLTETFDSEGFTLKVRCRQADQQPLAASLRDASHGQVQMQKL